MLPPLEPLDKTNEDSFLKYNNTIKSQLFQLDTSRVDLHKLTPVFKDSAAQGKQPSGR